MRQLTSAERRACPGYAYNVKVMWCFCACIVIAVFCGWVASRLLPADTAVADNRLFRMLGAFVPGIEVLAGWSAHPKLASVVYGIEWLFVPVYLCAWFIGIPPWSRTTRAAVRYTVRLREFGWYPRILVLVGMIFLAAYYLGDLRIIYFPTFLNGGLTPDTDWILPIYHSYLALAAFGAVGAVCECVGLWMLLLMVCNFDSYVLGKHLGAPSKA